MPQIVQQRLGQQAGSGQVQVVGAGQPQVQVVQQLGTQGQVVHQVRAQYTRASYEGSRRFQIHFMEKAPTIILLSH